MGFFDSLKGIAKDVAQNVMDDVVKEVADKVGFDMPGQSNAAARAAVAAGTAAISRETQVFAFQPVSVPNATQRQYQTYEYDENDNERVVVHNFLAPQEFLEFDSGAAEVEISIIYAPQDVEQGYVETVDFDKAPALYIGEDGPSADALSSYLERGTVKPGTEVAKVEGSIAQYKTTVVNGNSYLIAYHYYKKFCPNYYSHIVLQLPKSMKNTELGNYAENVLDCIVSTLKENVQ